MLNKNHQLKGSSAGHMEHTLSAKGSSAQYTVHVANKLERQFASALGTAVNYEACVN